MKRMILSFVAVTLVVAACGSEAGEDPGLDVVATTSIVGDIVSQVVGDRATVQVIMPVGADPHEFRPSARDVAAVQTADIVFAIGLGLEEGLADALEAARADGVTVVDIGPELDPLPFAGGHDHAADAEDGDADHDESEHDDEGGLDPHVWMDPLRVAEAARLVGRALTAFDGDEAWNEAAARYADELAALDAEIRSLLEAVPESRRAIVTNHDSLGYLADRYGFEIIGVVIPGGSTLADPSSGELAELVSVMRASGVDVIFGETIEPSAVAEAVAAEVGSDVEVVELYTGSLGEPGSGADTLAGMLRANAERMAAALGGGQ